MMKSLRRKFILFAMTAVTVLLVVLIIAINGLNWYLTQSRENEAMSMLVNRDETDPDPDFHRKPPAGSPTQPFPPPPDRNLMRSTPFFIVETGPDGEIIRTDMDRIFSVDSSDAEEYALEVLEKGTSAGMIDGFKYTVRPTENGNRLFFMDVSRQRESLVVMLSVSAAIAVVSWLIVLLFVILISGRVVHPIIAGMEKQKRFITDAGHELKTPLAIIGSNNDAMTLIHGENKYNRNIKAQVLRLNDLMSNMLTLARIDEEAEIPTEMLDVSALAAEITPAYQDTAETRGVSMICDITPDIVLRSNKDSLTKLITILLDNAIKYTDENGRISFTLTRTNGHVVITEENSCEHSPDIDPEQLFERFYRGDKARTQQTSGSGFGIGLSVARSICDSLGGRLTASYPVPGLIRFTAVF